MSIQEKCKNGFNWILNNHPEWIDNVDLLRLDQSSDKCIIGQNTSFAFFIEEYGHDFCYEHGFFSKQHADYALFTKEFKKLVSEYRNKIAQPAFYDCNQPTKVVEIESILNKTIDKVEMVSNVCSFQFKDGTTYYIDFDNAELRQVFKP